MPKNRLLYLGILVIVASVLLWIGAELTKRVEWILPYTGGLGVLLLIVGFFVEVRKFVQLRKPQPEQPSPQPSSGVGTETPTETTGKGEAPPEP